MSESFLHLRTLSFALMLVTGLMASAMFFIWRAQKTYPGTKYWFFSNLAGAIGFFCLGLKDFAPELVTVLIGNSIAVSTSALALEGNRRFLGLRPNSSVPLGIMAAYVVALTIFTYLSPDPPSRIILASGATSILAFLSYRAFAERPGLTNNVVYRTVGLTFLLFSILMFVRMITTMMFANVVEIYTPDWIQAVSFMVFLIFATVWSFNYVGMTNERLHEELRAKESELLELATTDFLTGLSNKRAFNEFASSEIKRSRRYSIPMSFVLLDLDHFKKINDTLGHAAGDAVLKEVGHILKKMSRQHDKVARLGGEEFGVLLTHTDLDTSHTVAETFRREIQNLEIEHSSNKIKITSSFGVAELRSSDTLDTVLDRADTHLYTAKDLGRNRVVSETRNGLRLFPQAKKNNAQ